MYGIFENVIFLNESIIKYKDNEIHYNNMSDIEIEDNRKHIKKAFNSINNNYDNMLKDMYKNQYLKMSETGKEREFKEFLHILELNKKYVNVSLWKKHNILYIEMFFVIHDIGNVVSHICTRFKYGITNGKISWEFDGSD